MFFKSFPSENLSISKHAKPGEKKSGKQKLVPSCENTTLQVSSPFLKLNQKTNNSSPATSCPRVIWQPTFLSKGSKSSTQQGNALQMFPGKKWKSYTPPKNERVPLKKDHFQKENHLTHPVHPPPSLNSIRFIFPKVRGENKKYLSCHHLVIFRGCIQFTSVWLLRFFLITSTLAPPRARFLWAIVSRRPRPRFGGDMLTGNLVGPSMLLKVNSTPKKTRSELPTL